MNDSSDQNATKIICRIVYDTGIPWHVLTDKDLTPPDVLDHLIEIAAKPKRGGCPWLK